MTDQAQRDWVVPMRFVTDVQKHVSVFISHCAENNDEARHYQQLLTNAGFTALQYSKSLSPGEKLKVLPSQIENCNFFLFIVSDYSEKSEWVQRELGLALEVQKRNSGYRPLIIPLYSREATWRRSGRRPDGFPTKNFFLPSEVREDFPLSSVRGLDKYKEPIADSDEVLISLMKPSILVSRLDFSDESTFYDTDVFTLYENLFPPVERDDPRDIIHWVLHNDIGKTRKVRLRDGTEIAYASTHGTSYWY